MKNKIKFLAAFALLSVGFANAQVGVGTVTPDASAVLDVSSTTKGLLLPRVASGASVTTPATGLVIFNTTTNQAEINTGTPAAPVWSALGGAAFKSVTLLKTSAYTALDVNEVTANNLTTITFNPDGPANFLITDLPAGTENLGKLLNIYNATGVGINATFNPAGAALTASLTVLGTRGYSLIWTASGWARSSY